MQIETILAIFFAFIIGVVFGGMGAFLSRGLFANRQIKAAQKRSLRIVADARAESKNIINEARVEIDKTRANAEAEARERRMELQRLENRLLQKEAHLDHKLEEVEMRERQMTNQEKELDKTREELAELKEKEVAELESISQLSRDDAKQLLLDQVEVELKQEEARRLHEWEVKVKDEAEERARGILAQVIQRNASEVVAETTSSTVPLPNDEMKGRLIGREGRNIRALEQATGVDLIIDDTPEAVTISSFDPVRREIAKQALNKLILDGRIHPSRIEEIVTKAKEEVEATIYSTGEQAAYQVGVHGLNPELIKLLGDRKSVV